MSLATLPRTRADLAFTIDAKPLASAIHWAASRVPARPAPAVLGGILLRVHDGRLTASAFDYEVAATATLDVDDSADGTALVSGRLLDGLLKTFPSKPVTASVQDDRLVLDCGTVHVSLPTMAVEDYPHLPVMPDPLGTVDAEAFGRAVERVGIATHPAAHPVVLTGMLLCFGDRLRLMASDSYRFGLDDISWSPALGTSDVDVLVQAEVLTRAAPMLAAGGDNITVSISDSLVGFTGNGRSLVARLMSEESRHRWLAEHLPAPSPTPLRLPVAEMSDALRRAELVYEPKTPILLDLTANEVSVRATGADSSAAGTQVACTYDGEPMTVKVNPTYMLDALKAVGGDEVEVSFTDPKKPFLVVPTDPADTYRQLVMPIRIPGASS